MEVIVEYVLIDNFVIDFVLLFCTNKMLNIPTNKATICLSAFLGAIFALLSPMLNVGTALLVLTKLIFAFLMVFVATFSFYKLFLRFVGFVCLTFLFGGMLIAVCYFLGISVVKGANLTYFSKLPVGSLLGAGVLFLMLTTSVIRKFYSYAKHAKYMLKVSLTINKKSIELNGFFDSGNTLRTKDDVPVVILKEAELKNWFNFEDRMSIMMGKFSEVKIKNPQKLEVCSVGTKTKLLIFDADNLRVNNRDFVVAVGIDNSRHFKNFSLLLNNKMGEVLC